MKIRNCILPIENYVRKNAPSLLTGIGIIGVVGTAVMAVRDSKKAELVIQRKNDYKLKHYGEQLTKFETAIVVTPSYLPTITTGLATISCIYGANSINKNRQAMLLSAYGYLNNCYGEYKDAVTDIYGPEAQTQIKENIMTKQLERAHINPDEDEILVYEEYTGSYITTTKQRIKEGLFHANKHFSWAGAMSINEALDCFDSFECEYGDVYGWTLYKQWESGEPIWLDASLSKYEIINGKQVYLLDWSITPATDYYNWDLCK
ncbi:MAG: DUF6353 family protein [Sarcina sp.]